MQLGRSARTFGFASVGLGVAGFSFGLYPEAGAVVLLLVVAIGLWRNNRTPGSWRDWLRGVPRSLSYALLIFSLLRIFVSLRLGMLGTGVLEGLAAFALILAGRWVWLNGAQVFGMSVLAGVTAAVLVAVVPYLESNLRGANLGWLDADGRVGVERRDGHWGLRPLDSSNAWLMQNESLQGAGRIRYSIKLRATQAFNLNQSVIHPGLIGGRVDRLCAVSTAWTRCDLEVVLPSRALTLMGIGGYNTWSAAGPDLEARDAQVIVLERPSLREVLGLSLSADFSPRLKGWSFNANAFAAHVVSLSTFGFLLVSNLAYFTVPFLLAGIWLSGSRNGLLSLLVGLALSVGVRLRRPGVGLLVLAGTVVLTGLVVWAVGWTVPSTLRPLNFNDGNGRGVVYQLALEGFRSEPIFGVGDLRTWMTQHINARDIPAGIAREDVASHAHNALLQVAGESGALGLVAWAVVLWFIVVPLVRRRDFAGLCALGVLGLLNIFDYFLFYAPVQAVFWFAASGVLARGETEPCNV